MTSRDAYDSAPPRGTALEWTRVYREGDAVAHLHSQAYSCRIACDDPESPRTPMVSEDCWLGTGSQDEYERARSLPLCTRCFAVRERGYADEADDPARPEQEGRS